MKRKAVFSVGLLLVAGAYLFYGFCQKDPFEARFPIVFNDAQLPKTEVKIEGVSYFLKIDLGASEPISLTSDILEKIEKKYHRSIKSFDLKGNEYSSKTYIIPEIKIRNLRASNFEVREESVDFLTDGSIIYCSEQNCSLESATANQGTLGRPLFQDINLFLDFHNATMFACRHLRDRKKEGYRLDRLVSLPMEKNSQNEIILKATTDRGVQRFMVDTGCTRSLIKQAVIQGQPCKKWRKDLEVWSSSKFVLGKKDFGSFDFLVFPIDARFSNFDGIIGMDFLRNHIVYFDFKKQVAYVGKAEECFPDPSKYPSDRSVNP